MAKSYEERVFVNPADRLISELGGTYYKLSEVAVAVGVSESTLRRLKDKKVLRAPSEQLTRGGMRVYLYTKEDVEEIRNYYAEEVESRYAKTKRHNQDDSGHGGRKASRRRPHGRQHQPRTPD